MPASTFAVSMDCPHATVPSVLVRIWISDEVGAVAPCYGQDVVWGSHDVLRLWIPSLETWTLDTVRMVFYELSAYVPFDDDAEAGVTLCTRKRSGRPRKNPTTADIAPIVDDVKFWVRSRGWKAEFGTNRNEQTRTLKDGQTEWGAFPTGEWSAPMLAQLTNLASMPAARLRSHSGSLAWRPHGAEPCNTRRASRFSGASTRFPFVKGEKKQARAYRDWTARVREILDKLDNSRDAGEGR